MQSIIVAMQFTGVLLGIPAALLAITDWRHRRHVLDLVAPSATERINEVVASPWAPPTAPVWAPPPVRQPQIQSSDAAEHRATLSLPRRVLSMLVDSYLWLIASVFIAGLLTDGESLASDDWTGADTVGGFIALGVFAALAAHNGRSLGKLVFGGRIVTTDDRPRTFGLVITRMLLAAALSVFFITHLAALGNPERQTLHDRITRTRVVRTR